MKIPELLSPVGDLECLKAAVQNGANAVYLGASNFNARARATNFDNENLKEAILYAKLRNVKVNLTLNILLKENELEDAVNLAIFAYNCGVDAIIVQDLGLAKILHENYPEIVLHASTQMTVHNLDGVKQLEGLGFKRVVLSRELSFDEIDYIRKNTDIELEVFIHGALCISYSGQCLFSSMVGNRSGNRGMCAQPCRLPYELYSNKNLLDKGYLLSPRDQNAIDFLPSLIKSGIDCFKIEGRLKTPEYVATVTRIYRKYIDLILDNIELSNDRLLEIIHNELKIKNVETNLSDEEELLQVFNRGNFSQGHFSNEPNQNLIYSKKSNNMGLFIGKIQNFNPQKGHITLKLENTISIGDRISINDENYTISELMIKNQNFPTVEANKIVTIGRMKGNLSNGMSIFKINSKKLNDKSSSSFQNGKEQLNIPLNASIKIFINKPIELTITGLEGFYKNISISVKSDIFPEVAKNLPITKEKIIAQLSKTGNTQFCFKNINIELEENSFITKISILNELRRNAFSLLEKKIEEIYTYSVPTNFKLQNENAAKLQNTHADISLMLNILNNKFNYLDLNNIDNVYIPYKYFYLPSYEHIIQNLCNKFKVFVFIPTIIKDKYINKLKETLEKAMNYKISGFVISHQSQIDLVKKYNLPIIGNFTLNIYNNETVNQLRSIGVSKIMPSVELDKIELLNFLQTNNLDAELLVYGKTPIMTNNYCYLGKSNKCYPECKQICLENSKFFLKDRLGFEFRILPDNSCTITTIYNSKITSINYNEFIPFISSVRIDILDENIDEIQKIINKVKNQERFEGKEYTNGKIK